MTTEKIRSFWRPLAIFLFVALIGVVVWMIVGQITDHQHGNTEMGDSNGGGNKKEWCKYRNFFDKTKAVLKYTGEYKYEGDYSSTSKDIDNIVVEPSVWEGASLSPYYSSFTVVMDEGSPHYKMDGSKRVGFELMADNDIQMPKPGGTSGEIISVIRYTVYIELVGLDANERDFTVKFLYPNAGLISEAHSDHEQTKTYSVTVCALSDNPTININDIQQEILNYLNEDYPGGPQPEGWPKFELIKEDDKMVLIPYFPKDFGK